MAAIWSKAYACDMRDDMAAIWSEAYACDMRDDMAAILNLMSQAEAIDIEALSSRNDEVTK